MITHYYICSYIIITYYYQVLLPIIMEKMGSLLPIITRSIMGNNGFISTYYWPGQLGDADVPIGEPKIKRQSQAEGIAVPFIIGIWWQVPELMGIKSA